MNKTLADKFRHINTVWIWSVVVFIVLTVGGIGTPWETIQSLLENQGPTDEQSRLLAFVAGYTLPLTFGFGLVVFLQITGQMSNWSWYSVCGITAVILIAAGLVASYLGLGLVPDFSAARMRGGPLPIMLLVWVSEAYLFSYGWTLVLCSLAIGAASAIHTERLFNQTPSV